MEREDWARSGWGLYALQMIREIEKTLITRDEIKDRVKELGEQIATDLAGELSVGGEDLDDQVILVPILTGSIVFVADLIREMPLRLRLGLVTVSSYPGKTIESKGAAIRGELPQDLSGKHVLVVDDILDSGRTLALIKGLIDEQKPASLRICVLLQKELPLADTRLKADYVGFTIPDEFVVGYGLDYDGYYRNHPEIAVLKGDAV